MRGVPGRMPVIVGQFVVVEVQVLAAAVEGDVEFGQLDEEPTRDTAAANFGVRRLDATLDCFFLCQAS
jgi:hypothetical protein